MKRRLNLKLAVIVVGVLAVLAGTAYVLRKAQVRRNVGALRDQARLKASQGTRFVLRTSGRSSTYYVRCIPADLFAWKATRYGPTQAQWWRGRSRG